MEKTNKIIEVECLPKPHFSEKRESVQMYKIFQYKYQKSNINSIYFKKLSRKVCQIDKINMLNL